MRARVGKARRVDRYVLVTNLKSLGLVPSLVSAT